MYKPEIKNGYYQFNKEKIDYLKKLYEPKRVSKLKRLWRLFISYIQTARVTRLS